MASKVTAPHAVLALVGIFLDTFIYTPLIIYWSFNIWKQRQSLIIRKRHCRIIITIGIVSCFYYCIQRNIGFLIYSEILSVDITLILTYLNCYLYPIFNYGLFYIMVYRYWLLYYKTKFAAAQANGEWQMIINPAEFTQNWWIRNKKRFGSGHFLKKYILLLWIFIVCTEGTLWLFSYYLNSYLLTYAALICDFLIMLFPFILTIYIRQHLPLLIDKLFINQELKSIFLIILLAFIVIALLSSIIAALSYFGVSFVVYIAPSLYNTVSNISTFGTFLCVFIQTQWVINKFRAHLHYYSSRQRIKLNTTFAQQILLTKKEKKENRDKISISDVLTHNQAFYVFMNHLIAEHSSECLLSLVEMIQFKESILNKMKISESDAATKELKQETQKEEEPKKEEEAEEITKRSSTVQRNINALSLALSGAAARSVVDDNSMLFGVQTPPTKTRLRSASFVPLTNNGLISLPSNVPQSAIVFNERMDILMDIPGVEISPARRRITIDRDVINKSRLMSVSQDNRASVMFNETNANAAEADIELINKNNERKKSFKGKRDKSVNKKSKTELIEEYKIRSYMLYYKYVAIDSEFEINIDYATRNKLMFQMNDINKWLKNKEISLNKLSLLFDVCIHEMYQFCKFSMGRFKQSDDFQALVTCFNIKPKSPQTP